MRYVKVGMLLLCIAACSNQHENSQGLEGCDAMERVGNLEGANLCYDLFITSHQKPSHDLLAALNRRASARYRIAAQKYDLELAGKAIQDWYRYLDMAKEVPDVSVNSIRQGFGCALLGLQRVAEAIEQFNCLCTNAPDAAYACDWADTLRSGSVEGVCKMHNPE